MQYHFSIGAFFIGLLILATGVAFVKWYQVIADNMGGGVSSYERYRMWAFITCGVGFLVMTNLHVFLLVNLLHTVFPGI